MENRRAIYNARDKIKNTHAKHKLNKGEFDKRLKRVKSGDLNQGPIEDLEPAVYTKTPKTVVSDVCVICFYPMAAPSPICPNCRNCQSCGKYNEDAYSTSCGQCGNHIDGPRLDDNAPSRTADNAL